jgi:hypothetical protein
MTQLAERLVRAASRRNFTVVAEVLAYLDPERVDVFVYIRSPNAHLSIIGSYRNLYVPRDSSAIPEPPTIAQIAQVLEEVAK